MQKYLDSITAFTLFDNTLVDYIAALSIFLAGLVLVRLLKIVILRRLSRWAERTEARYDDMIVDNLRSKIMPLLYFGAFYAALSHLKVAVSITKGLNVAALVLVIFFSLRFIMVMVVYWLNNYWVKDESDTSRKSASIVLATIIKLVLWSIGILIFLDNMGIKISAFIAGLGIGGVAVAFAAQAILSDIFSYFSIFLDRPFEIGDFIIVDNHMGSVEHIGIKTTRIRSLSGEQLVFSNADLTGSRLRNFKRMERRRVAFKFGVTYDTKTADLKKIPGIVKDIIDAIEIADFDRAHFLEFGDFSLNFETVYYVNSSDYLVYCNTQQEINLKLKQALEKRKVEFAFPTSTVYVQRLKG